MKLFIGIINIIIMKIFYNKYILILILIYTLWLWGLPFIFSKTLPIVCKNFSYNSSISIDIINPKLTLNILPYANFGAQEINIKHKEKNDCININNLNVQVRVLPLFSGRLHINKIEAKEIKIVSFLGESITLDRHFFNKLKNARIKCDEIKVEKFLIKAISPNNIEGLHYGKNVHYKKGKRYIKFNLDSNIKVQDKLSEIYINLCLPKNNDIKKSRVNIKVSNLNIQPLGDFLRSYLPKDTLRTQGIINLSADKNNLTATFENCAMLAKDNAKSIILPPKLVIQSSFDITRKKIKFNSININSENIHALINGSIMNYIDKPLTSLNLSVTLNNSKVEDIVEILPPVILEEINIYKLKKYKFYGDVIGNFTIKGHLPEPDINGNIYIRNGILISPIPGAKGATIKIKLLGKYLTFDVTVPASISEKVWVKGGVELYNIKYSDMRIWSTKNVSLQTAEEKILPLHEILNFIIGPVPIMNIRGDGNIDINVKGNRKTPHIWGAFNARNVSTFFNDMPDLILKNAEAELLFNDEKIVFNTKNGNIDGKKIDINGTCNLDGKFDFNVKTTNQRVSYMLNSIKNSSMLRDIQNLLPEFSVAEGFINLDIKVYGTIKYIEDMVFNKNLFASGEIELLGNTFGLKIDKNIPELVANKAIGTVNFNNNSATVDVNAYIKNSPMSINGLIKNNFADVAIDIPNLNLIDIFSKDNQLLKDIGNVNFSLKTSYKGKLSKIEFDKINLKATVLNTMHANKIKVLCGEISLKNDKLNIKNLNGTVNDTNSSFKINMNVNGVSTNKARTNGQVELKDFELPIINTFTGYSFIPQALKDLKFNNGKINLNCRINNNKITAYTDLGGLALTYIPYDLPIQIVNGSLSLQNEVLKLNKINTILDDMPLLIDGEIEGTLAKNHFNLYINSKPKQDFIDKYINKNRIYPIKIKGDVISSARFKGCKNNYNVKANLQLAKEGSIYYLGATVGDIENSIVLDMDARVINQNNLKIKEFTYDKIISSLGARHTRLNMLKAYGGIDIYQDDLIFKNLYIKTHNPTDARIFNIIFRKPNIKQGQFISDLKFNGKLSNPKLSGIFHIFETNIPFFDTTLKNISFIFKEKTIEISSTGEVLGNDITFHGILKNKLSQPYVIDKLQVNAKILDLDYIANKLKLSQADNIQTLDSFDTFDISSIIVNELKMHADSIRLKNIVADNFEANASLNNKKVFNIDSFKFNIANGVLKGSVLYDLINYDTKLKLYAKDIDADALSFALFDLRNQIYGDLTGNISLACKGMNFENCMKTLNGNLSFNVESGRMPKLGSLEYLLKAGNLVKGGLTGISINSIIDIITPLKTGEFSNIYGQIDITDGIANNIEITTQGKDLSLFITGTYNCATSIADMEVFGLLSKKISTMLGSLGNISLNTLLNVIPGVDLTKESGLLQQINKIPGIELSNKSFRKFIAEIKGNINGDNYVTSFKWIN